MEKKENCQQFAELTDQELNQISGGNWLKGILSNYFYVKSTIIKKP